MRLTVKSISGGCRRLKVKDVGKSASLPRRLRMPLLQRASPSFFNFQAQPFSFLPATGKCVEIVPEPKRSHFRNGDEFAAGGCGCEPGFHHLFHERHKIEEFRREPASPVCYRHLAMMSIKGAEVKLLRELNEIGPFT